MGFSAWLPLPGAAETRGGLRTAKAEEAQAPGDGRSTVPSAVRGFDFPGTRPIETPG